MKRLWAVASVLASLAASTGAPAQVVLPATPPQPVRLAAPAPDPAKLALARELVEASGGAAQADAVLKSMFGAIRGSLDRSMPPEAAQLSRAIYEDLEQEVVTLVPRLLDIGAKVYAENFTEQEMRDLIAFQTSASGRAIRQKSPQIQAQVLAEEMPLLMAGMPDILRKSVARACETHRCSASERRAVDAALAKLTQHPGG